MSTVQLSCLFDEARSDFEKAENGEITPQNSNYESHIRSIIQKWKNCLLLISELHLFSSNEELEDISTSLLKYILVPYYLSLSFQKSLDMKERLASLELSRELILKFVNNCVNLGIISEKEVDQRTKLNPSEFRTRKIERLTQKKSLESKLKIIEQRLKDSNLEEGCDEEDQRDYYILTIELCAKNSIDELNLIDQEIEILKHRNTLEDANEKNDIRTKEFSANKKEEMNRIPECFVIDKRLRIQKMVFKPHWIQPTISLEEFGELEYRNMMKRKEECKVEGSVSDEEASDCDSNLKKERNWDDWKDDHPRGSGNTGNKGYAY